LSRKNGYLYKKLINIEEIDLSILKQSKTSQPWKFTKAFNNMSKLQGQSFVLKNWKVPNFLDMSCNQIKIVSYQQWAENLKESNLSNNKILEIPGWFFTKLWGLTKVNQSRNWPLREFNNEFHKKLKRNLEIVTEKERLNNDSINSNGKHGIEK